MRIVWMSMTHCRSWTRWWNVMLGSAAWMKGLVSLRRLSHHFQKALVQVLWELENHSALERSERWRCGAEVGQKELEVIPSGTVLLGQSVLFPHVP